MKPIFCKGKKKSDNISELIEGNLTFDASVFRDVLEYGFILGDKTPFKEIKREHKITINRKNFLTDIEEIKSLFLNYLKKSISQNVSNGQKVGLFLSGGIDSTSLAILIGNYFKDLEVYTYTASFKGNEEEVVKAEEISKKYGFVHRIVEVNKGDFDKWNDVIRAIGMPICDEASIPLFKLAEAAQRDGINTILMGDGNDELWCGYDEYYTFKKIKQKMPYYFPELGKFLTKLNIPKIRGIGKILQSKNWEEVVNSKNLFDLQEIVPHCWLEQRYGIVRYFDISPKFPFLNQELINLACNVPLSLKLKKSNKWLIKEAIAIIDKDILGRKKRFMKFPKKEMFKANKNKIKQTIKSSKIINYSPLDNYLLTHRKFIIALWYNIFAKNFNMSYME